MGSGTGQASTKYCVWVLIKLGMLPFEFFYIFVNQRVEDLAGGLYGIGLALCNTPHIVDVTNQGSIEFAALMAIPFPGTASQQ